MAAELDLGPVDYFLVGFPPGAPLDGGALAQMGALVDAGIIEVLDALVLIGNLAKGFRDCLSG